MRSKVHLGQNFLRDQSALQRIVAAARLSPTDIVLEVGPGDGALTEHLLSRAGRVVAVEKDERLVALLRKKFARDIISGKLHLIHGDILSFTPIAYRLVPSAYKIVANIPYYITGAFLKKFLQSEHQPMSMTLLLQKEVAERIIAADDKESILSISVKCYGMPRIVGFVGAAAFSPPPKVDSAIVAIENISRNFFYTKPPLPRKPSGFSPLDKRETQRGSNAVEGVVEQKFFSLLKRGFAHPRKLLASNLKIPIDALAICGIAEKARAEEVSLTEWKCLVLNTAAVEEDGRRETFRHNTYRWTAGDNNQTGEHKGV